MNRRATTGVSAAGLALGAVLAVGLAAPASAAPVNYPVDIVNHVEFGVDPGAFESTFPGCESGWVTEGPSHVGFTPWGGAFKGLKEFTCAGEEAGFTIRLNARFGELGSTGSWTFVDGWGLFEGIKGSGSLVGTPTDAGIDDHYIGSAR